MEIVNIGRKWKVVGQGDGWIFRKTLPTKWKAVIAVRVFEQGGRVSDYWSEARKEAARRPLRIPYRAIGKLQDVLDEIDALDLSGEEITAYGQIAGYGEVTWTRQTGYFPPRIHDTWQLKRGGRVHIDIGWDGCHLMLNAESARAFVEFIKARRKT